MLLKAFSKHLAYNNLASYAPLLDFISELLTGSYAMLPEVIIYLFIYMS
jgi:hypothetical protein